MDPNVFNLTLNSDDNSDDSDDSDYDELTNGFSVISTLLQKKHLFTPSEIHEIVNFYCEAVKESCCGNISPYLIQIHDIACYKSSYRALHAQIFADQRDMYLVLLEELMKPFNENDPTYPRLFFLEDNTSDVDLSRDGHLSSLFDCFTYRLSINEIQSGWFGNFKRIIEPYIHGSNGILVRYGENLKRFHVNCSDHTKAEWLTMLLNGSIREFRRLNMFDLDDIPSVTRNNYYDVLFLLFDRITIANIKPAKS